MCWKVQLSQGGSDHNSPVCISGLLRRSKLPREPALSLSQHFVTSGFFKKLALFWPRRTRFRFRKFGVRKSLSSLGVRIFGLFGHAGASVRKPSTEMNLFLNFQKSRQIWV